MLLLLSLGPLCPCFSWFQLPSQVSSECAMFNVHQNFYQGTQVTGCRPSPSSDHCSRICRQACSTCLSFSLTARMTPPRKWSARASFSQSAETSSTTLTTLPLTPTNLCSCHISGLSPARRKYTCYHGTYYTSTDMTVHHTLYGNTIGSQRCRLCLHV